MSETPDLTQQEESFCIEYLRHGNASKAYRESFDVAHWKPEAVWVEASKMLSSPKVSLRVKQLRSQMFEASSITVERIAKEFARIGFQDPRAVMKWGPNGVELKDSCDLTEDEAAIVAEVSQVVTKEGGSIKLKTHDKLKALSELAKAWQMYQESVTSVTVNTTPQRDYSKLSLEELKTLQALREKASVGAG